MFRIRSASSFLLRCMRGTRLYTVALQAKSTDPVFGWNRIPKKEQQSINKIKKTNTSVMWFIRFGNLKCYTLMTTSMQNLLRANIQTRTHIPAHTHTHFNRNVFLPFFKKIWHWTSHSHTALTSTASNGDDDVDRIHAFPLNETTKKHICG